MLRIAWKWTPVGLGLLTVAVFTGCQSAGSRSLAVKNDDPAIEPAAQEIEAAEQPHRLVAATETIGGTSIQDLPARKDRAPARRAFVRSSSCST